MTVNLGRLRQGEFVVPVALCTGDRSEDVTMQRCLRLVRGVSRGMLVAQGKSKPVSMQQDLFNGRCGMCRERERERCVFCFCWYKLFTESEIFGCGWWWATREETNNTTADNR